jgi:hypothetical protein
MLAKLSRIYFLPALILAVVLLGGCDSTAPTAMAESGIYPVDPVLREFYASLGGRETLGPAITSLFNYRGKECQYAQNALLCFDPLAEGIARFSLEPLGDTLGIFEEPGLVPGGGLVVDGYSIYEEFEEMYHRLYGPLYVGRPLTQPRFNVSKDRIEQYFQNVGFYRNIGDEAGDVHLLSYGVYACSADCRYTPPQSAIVSAVNTEIAQPYLSQIVRLGGLNVFGMPLTDPYLAADGNLEQIYENVVLFVPQGDSAGLRLRPVALELGMPVAPPGPQLYSEEQGVVFYGVDGGLGYHVPLLFDQFLAQHGGREISGKPLAEISQISENLFRQCFENYCLLFDNSAAESMQVRMAPLGVDYLNLTHPQQASSTTAFEVPAVELRLMANPALTRIPASQPQRFEVFVTRADDTSPLANIESQLTLILPDGSSLTYAVPPTDAQGRASLTVDPIQPLLPNGAVVSFKVCLNIPADETVCASDSYLIWDIQ